MAKDDLSAERLRELLQYDPESGLWTWRFARAGVPRAGMPAGCMSRRYVVIGIDGKLYRAHRLAWLYMTSEWPKNHVDHINGNGADNRWENLRDVSRFVNLQNRHRADVDSSSGVLGVSKFGSTWKAEIRSLGIRKYLGTFASKEDAHAAYLAAKKAMHPESQIAANASAGPAPLGRRLGKSGIRGVRKINNRWYAYMHTPQGQKHLGAFSSAEEASAAYQYATAL